MTQTDADQLTGTLKELRTIVNNLLIVLSPKEKHIIENRFSLNDHPRATLEKIGREFGVTRERIRQIEKNALKKLQRNVNNTKLHILNQYANTVIQKFDGIATEEKLINEILKAVPSPETIDRNAIKLSMQLDQNLEKDYNTINFRPHWKLKLISRKFINEVCTKTASFLSKKKDVVLIDDVVQHLQGALGHGDLRLSKQRVASSLELDRRIKVVKTGVGLASWRHINPKTLRDKILFVLRASKKPLHFVEIANRISDSSFDKKTVNVQAVHNELIRFDQFVLIGRGIYALKEWGYERGTVADVLKEVLREHGSLDRDKVIEEVLKHRQVKRITIILNLKNKDLFERVGRNMYTLRK
jgi:hypothetical protein